MNFISLDFLVFATIFFTVYPFVSPRYSIVFITAFSLFFYGYWDFRYVPLLVFSAAIDYVCALKIHGSQHQSIRKRWLWLAVALNAGTLIFFKYWNFFAVQIDHGVGIQLALHNLILPLGISFYTLQTVSYTIDVYKKQIKPERNFLTYFMYVSFFPQLVAGPIERAGKLLPQLKSIPVFTFENFRSAVLIVIWGVFLKVAVADNLASFVGNALRSPDAGYLFFLVCPAAMLQVYCDFFGYTLIAIGIAKGLGVNLSENFRYPFLETSLRGFWQSWHISLTRWITDYIHIPIVQRFPNEPYRSLSAIGAMCLVGLWHGASWNFILFGLLHGIVLRVWRPCGALLSKIPAPDIVRELFARACLLMIVGISSPLFMVTDMAQILVFFNGLFSSSSGLQALAIIPGKMSFLIGCALGGLVLLNDVASKRKSPWNIVAISTGSPKLAFWLSVTLVAAITLFSQRGGADFVYFQF